MVNRSEVPAPMYISARLMAALNIGCQCPDINHDAHPKAPGDSGNCIAPAVGVLHVEWTGRTDSAGRAGVRYVIEDATGAELGEGSDLHVRGGYRDAMETLLTFLCEAAEAYRYQMRTGHASRNADLFPPAVMEWAYQNSEALSYAEIELAETEGE